jgi:uncharacterized protein (TIGR02246 family)
MRQVLGILGGIILFGCASDDGHQQGSPKTAIQQIWNDYSASLTAGDADRWLSLWDEGGVQLPPDAPPVEGKIAISSKIRGILDQFKFEMSVHNLEVQPAGDWAFSRGAYQARLIPKKGGAPIQIDGKYLTVLRKQGDGSWKIYRDMFNSNLPPGKRD